jgi:lactoylglutathione lyase
MPQGCTPVTIARIDRLALWTTRLEPLRDFYAAQLGAQASAVYERPDGAGRAVFLDFCGVGLELIEPPAGAEPPTLPQVAGCPYIAFGLGSADAVDRLTARLAEAGHQVIEPPHRTGEGPYQSAVLDPDGNRVELTV